MEFAVAVGVSFLSENFSSKVEFKDELKSSQGGVFSSSWSHVFR